ncbi:BTAD domain-containing putative transcriptional regulator [Bailinhaonella thermotolerans]|uniref:OmpR/PhoB-type domain-containing protein n=1 Tax=Bailinhaonella thermotolerans TaxID=1070861 RepID=A0A3A4B8P2_9ACTN|nr:BTAD domain-containing putative transcriptional regulator [Bailinhaonella thermotolerans]RJL34054.1 hypothetical protein D5H75_06000 [Bailinhaonella thermotolerans]
MTRRICLVTAGPGWGKTTALAAWARAREHSGNPVIWLGRPADTRELLGPLAARLPAPPRPGPDAAAVCAALDAALREDLVVVLDDADEVPGPVADVLAAVCRLAPPRLRLVLACRREPPLPLGRLRGQGRVADVDARELAFRRGEETGLIEALLGPDGLELAPAVHYATGGWPAAVRLMVDGLRRVPRDRLPAELERQILPGGRLAAYVADEVLAAEPPGNVELLRHLTAFRQADDHLCRALGFSSAAGALADLARRGLVRRADGGETWAPAAPIRAVLEHHDPLPPAQRVIQHRRAAAYFGSRAQHARALAHLLAADDHAGVAALLIEHGTRLVDAGEIDAVLATAALPPRFLDDPRIQQVLGHARQIRGQWADALDCFARAAGDHDELEPALAWRTALVPQSRGYLGEALKIYQRARVQEGEQDAETALLWAWRAAAHRATGDRAACREHVTQALALADRCGDASARCAAYTALASLAAAEGDRAAADAYGLAALEAGAAGGSVLHRAWAHTERALNLLAYGMTRAAAEEADVALDLCVMSGHRALRAFALTVRGCARRASGRPDEGVTDLRAACAMFEELGSRYVAWPLCGLADVHRVRGELLAARTAYEHALALTEASGEVIGLTWALAGLARVRAADDHVAARGLADRAVAVGDGLLAVQALLARGWVSLGGGDVPEAVADAERAAALARERRDLPGHAEALLLRAMCEPAAGTAEQAALLWEGIDDPVGAAHAALAAARAAGPRGRGRARLAEEALRRYGVRLDNRAAGPLASSAAPVPELAVQVLGAFAVTLRGRPVPTSAWRSRKARDLLKILVARRGRPVTRERLMELLWPCEEPGRAARRLSVLLSTLRSVLESESGAEPVAGDGSAVWLDLTLARVDLEDFLSAAAEAVAADDAGRDDALDALLAAAEACTGPFLEGDPGQEWADAIAEEVRAAHMTVLRRLAVRLRDRGDVDGSVRYALRLLEHDPYDEETHLWLVGTLREALRRGEARRRYEIYARLMGEIGVDPAPWPGRRP